MKDPNRRRHRADAHPGFSGHHPNLNLWKDKAVPSSSASSSASSFSSFGGGRRRSLILFCLLLSVVAFSVFRAFGVSFSPVLISTWKGQQSSALNVVADYPTVVHKVENHTSQILHAITFPDLVMLLLRNPPQFPVPTSTLRCLYLRPSDTTIPHLTLQPISLDSTDQHFLVQCPLPPSGLLVAIADGGEYIYPPVQQLRRWDFVSYSSYLDLQDNSTVIFVKGLNLRADRLSDATRFECVFGWQFNSPKYLISSQILTVAQEVVRCKTPLSVLRRSTDATAGSHAAMVGSVLASVRIKGRGVGGIAPSVAHPVPVEPPPHSRPYTMCVCTMVRNQAKFLKEWIMYHARIGVQRWFLYDNNSDDMLSKTVGWMEAKGYNVSRHAWPWVKTQEAGFAHCALRARSSCEWLGFIDVDEFLYFPSMHNMSLHDVLRNHSRNHPWVGELRTACRSFGPSGHKTPPAEGLTVGYTCRVLAPERHKSIVRPEALNPSLMNVVHHFYLRDGLEYMNMDRRVMVINHYKYQAWEVFKEKFYRRVATYVADWQEEENVGSKDRAPGLGTRAVEPPDWPTRFCEVNDTGLRDWVQETFSDPSTGRLPWL